MQNTWNCVRVLVRKVFVDHTIKFLVYIATFFDDIWWNIAGQEVWDPRFKPIDYEIPKKDADTKFLFYKALNTGFMARETTLDFGFGVHKFGHKVSDFSGTFAGSNYYRTWINTISVQKLLFFPEMNHLHDKGKMRNFAFPEDEKLQGMYLTKDRDGNELPFVDEVSMNDYEVSFIKVKTYQDADNPNELNTIMSGDLEISDNLALFGLETIDETIEDFPLFIYTSKNGLEVLKIEHRILVPRKADPNYYTISKIRVTLILGWANKKRVEVMKESKPIQLSWEPNGKIHYKFQLWTTLLPIYFQKLKPTTTFNDMKTNFMDNTRNSVYSDGQSPTSTHKKSYSLLLGQTFEDYSKLMPLYIHKYLSYSHSLASHNHTKNPISDTYAIFSSRILHHPVMCTIGYMLVQPSYYPSDQRPFAWRSQNSTQIATETCMLPALPALKVFSL